MYKLIFFDLYMYKFRSALIYTFLYICDSVICENNRLVKFYVCESCWSATRIFRYIR